MDRVIYLTRLTNSGTSLIPVKLTRTDKELKKEQFNIRFKKKNGQVTNTASIKTNRRSIATVKTFINLNRAK